jgi:hypothetical protein
MKTLITTFNSIVTLFLILAFTISAGNVFSQLSISTAGIDHIINFDNTVASVNNDSIKGTGFIPTPAAGQFDSDAWEVTGWSDGTLIFGGTRTSGDYARGVASAPVSTGGFYSFKISSNNYALGIQPGGSDWAPGTLTLRIQNNTVTTLSGLTVSYTIYVRNDQPRANSFNFLHSANNSNFTQINSLDYTSPAAAAGTEWIVVPRTTVITGLNVDPGAYYYLRWAGADAGGSGSRDEFALNDIIINATASGSIPNPVAFAAASVSPSVVELSWELNINADSVLIAFNTTNAFGTPSGPYAVGGNIPGGGTILYKGTGMATSHTGLTAEEVYYYKAWSKTATHVYSSGVTDSASTQSLEPTGHPTGITAVSNGPTNITVSWNDSDADHYLVKGSSVGYNSIVPPADGIAQGDSLLVKNVNEAVQSHQFTGLTPNTTYYFKVYPYNGTGEASNYKTDGSIPQASATTDELDLDLIISEVSDPLDSAKAKFVELYNFGTETIDFGTTPVYLCRQANGGSWASILLTGSITPGDTYLLAYTFSSTLADSLRFQNAYGFEPDLISNFISGNGNDGYFLYYGGNQSSGFLVDAFGVIGEDGEGTPWEYTDTKAVRKRAVTGPNLIWTASEWEISSGYALAKDMTPGYHNGDITWQGTVSSNWNVKGSNWNSPNGYIPDASCNVTIPNAANYPIVTEPSSCNQVLIQTGSTLSIQSSGSLKICGQ